VIRIVFVAQVLGGNRIANEMCRTPAAFPLPARGDENTATSHWRGSACRSRRLPGRAASRVGSSTEWCAAAARKSSAAGMLRSIFSQRNSILDHTNVTAASHSALHSHRSMAGGIGCHVGGTGATNNPISGDAALRALVPLFGEVRHVGGLNQNWAAGTIPRVIRRSVPSTTVPSAAGQNPVK
jgi:hypothetical protein